MASSHIPSGTTAGLQTCSHTAKAPGDELAETSDRLNQYPEAIQAAWKSMHIFLPISYIERRNRFLHTLPFVLINGMALPKINETRNSF